MFFIEGIVQFLKANLDKYSLIKANNTKLFNLSIEKSRNNAKPQIKLVISQIDYLFNIFIPFLNSLDFKSKKALDFSDFKLITSLIYQGKHLIPEVKSFILQLSYTMNNYRLSTYSHLNLTSSPQGKNEPFSTDDKNTFLSPVNVNLFKDQVLALPPLFLKNNDGQVINIKTGEIIRDRDTFVVF